MGEAYKLMSYNTSWVNDCNNNQLHNFLSESASIVAKAQYIDNMDQINFSSIAPLNNFRMSLADKSTEYIAEKIKLEYDFIALIEQIIHVPNDNHANYDSFDLVKAKRVNNLQNIEDNKKFGILRRINLLNTEKNILADVSSVDDATNNTSVTYGIVYDHIVHTAEGFGEGIGIIFKQSLIDTPLKWQKNSQPIVKKLLAAQNAQETSISSRLVRYYSDDLGQFVAPTTITGNPILSKLKGKAQADLARPIIMTAGIKDNTLNIFVAFHGPNILNLWYWGKTNGEEIKEHERKQLKVLLNDSNFANTITEIFNFIAQGISDFINEGLRSIEKQYLYNVTKVNVFLGCDANDPKGTLLNSLLTNGLSINVNSNTSQHTAITSFDNPASTVATSVEIPSMGLPPVVNTSSTVITTQSDNTSASSNKTFPVTFNYTINIKEPNPDLLTCCANADSVLVTNNSINTLGNVDTDTLKRLECYPKDFYKPENFAYYGDYALFGSSGSSGLSNNTIEATNIPPTYVMKKDNDISQQYTANSKTVIASDHLPVISEVLVVPAFLGGRRKTIRRNKKSHRRMRKYTHMTHKRNGRSRNRKNSRK